MTKGEHFMPWARMSHELYLYLVSIFLLVKLEGSCDGSSFYIYECNLSAATAAAVEV